MRTRVFVIFVIPALFLFGRFYKEIEAFFNTPWSLVGLLLVISSALLYALVKAKIGIMREQHYNEVLEQRQEQFADEIFYLKQKNKKLKKRVAELTTPDFSFETACQSVIDLILENQDRAPKEKHLKPFDLSDFLNSLNIWEK